MILIELPESLIIEASSLIKEGKYAAIADVLIAGVNHLKRLSAISDLANNMSDSPSTQAYCITPNQPTPYMYTPQNPNPTPSQPNPPVINPSHSTVYDDEEIPESFGEASVNDDGIFEL